MNKNSENLKNAIIELEKINTELNNGEIDVDKGLEKFREGVKLIKFCRAQIKKAENEFVKLKQELETEDSNTPNALDMNTQESEELLF